MLAYYLDIYLSKEQSGTFWDDAHGLQMSQGLLLDRIDVDKASCEAVDISSDAVERVQLTVLGDLCVVSVTSI